MEALFDSAGGALYSSAETSGNRIHSTPGDSAAYFHGAEREVVISLARPGRFVDWF